jgi:hypothetical protein
MEMACACEVCSPGVGDVEAHQIKRENFGHRMTISDME